LRSSTVFRSSPMVLTISACWCARWMALIVTCPVSSARRALAQRTSEIRRQRALTLLGASRLSGAPDLSLLALNPIESTHWVFRGHHGTSTRHPQACTLRGRSTRNMSPALPGVE
jgi:hypothetical protein